MISVMIDLYMRKWKAWHHHMALVMMAMLFIFSNKCFIHHPNMLTFYPKNVAQGS